MRGARFPGLSANHMRHRKRQDSDVEALVAHFDGDMGLLGEIAEIFLRAAPQLLDEIAGAVRRQDPERLEHAAHSLRGSLLNLCATRAADAAVRLEQMGAARDLDDGAEESCLALAAEVELVVRKVRRALGH